MRAVNITDNIDIAVNSAVECEIRHLRIKIFVLAVVNNNSDNIHIGVDKIGYLEAEH